MHKLNQKMSQFSKNYQADVLEFMNLLKVSLLLGNVMFDTKQLALFSSLLWAGLNSYAAAVSFYPSFKISY